MMVDVMVKSKKDRLPKPPCLEMLVQSSFFRLKELIKVKIMHALFLKMPEIRVS